jgi:MATE family multidrug resistance protein
MSSSSLDHARTPLTWTGHPGRELARLAWPIAVSTLSYAAMTVVGTAFVAHTGADAVAGVGLAGVVSFTLLCFAIGVLRGGKTLVAQALGAGRRADVQRYLGVAVLAAGALGLAATALALALAPVVGALAHDDAVGAHATTYLRLRALAAPLVLVGVAIREVRWGEGDTRGPMRAALAGNLVNFALNLALIPGAGWGVVGAGVAALVGNAIELALLAAPVTARLRRVSWDASAAGALWRQGAPTGVQFLLEVGSFLLLTTILAGLSAEDAGAHNLVLQLTHLSFLPAHALGEAASVLVGNAVGAGRFELVPRVARRALLLGAIYTAACTLVFALAARPLAFLLGGGDDPALLAVTTTLIQISAAFLVADAANVIARGVLRGAGDVRYAAVIGVVTAWCMTPPTAWLLGRVAGWGAAGGWIGLTGEIVVGAVILWRRVARGAWRHAATASRREVRGERAVHEDVAAPSSSDRLPALTGCEVA